MPDFQLRPFQAPRYEVGVELVLEFRVVLRLRSVPALFEQRIGRAHHRHYPVEVVAPAGNLHIAVKTDEHAVGVASRRRGGAPHRYFAIVLVRQQHAHAPVYRAYLRLHQRHIHMLAALGEHRAHSGGRGDCARLVQHDVLAELQRFAVVKPGRVHLAAHAVDYEVGSLEVAVWPRLSEVGD